MIKYKSTFKSITNADYPNVGVLSIKGSTFTTHRDFFFKIQSKYSLKMKISPLSKVNLKAKYLQNKILTIPLFLY